MTEPEEDPRNTRLREILLYMAGLITGVALLALVLGWVLTKL